MLLPLIFVYVEVTSFTINDVGQIALEHLDQIARPGFANSRAKPSGATQDHSTGAAQALRAKKMLP